MMADPSTLTRTGRWLARSSVGVLTAWAGLSAFSAYCCMYGFRKGFAAATFSTMVQLPLIPPIDEKTLLIVAQVIGYAISKFLGIRVVAEIAPRQRALTMLGLIGVSEVALVLFGLVPTPWSALCLLLNGLPLGMVWGLVYGFLEGRRVSDVLGAMLCASFILASGLAKTVGRLVLGWGVPEAWMPALAGALFTPPLLASVWMLAQVPAPTPDDETARARRAPMNAAARATFLRAWAPGIVILVAGYIVLTAFRDFRDNFAREIWDALGYAAQPQVLSTAEIPVTVGALLATASLIAMRNNRLALLAIHGLMVAGAVLLGASTLGHALGMIGHAAWMVLAGLGLFVAYVPFNCVLFDRLVAAVRSPATAGFLIYVADAFGYLGSVLLLLVRSFGQPSLPWVDFFSRFSYVTAISCAALFGMAGLWFWRRTGHQNVTRLTQSHHEGVSRR